MKKYPIAKPYITKDAERGVIEVLRSGVLSIGPYVQKFEELFATYVGTKYACAVSNGTAGLHLALIAAGIGAGDEVITTPFSFIASANEVMYVGAKPVFVDIDPFSYNMDPSKIEAKITKKTKALLIVHIFGQSADMAAIMAIARRYKLVVIEDACESLGASYDGKKVGTFGQSAVFAFYPNKQMTTGEGGMIVTNKRKVYELCKSLRNQGRAPNMQWLDHERLGYNYRLAEMSAALGFTQIKKINFLIKKRQEIAGWYTQALLPYAEFVRIPEVVELNIHSWFVYVVGILPKNINRDELITNLSKRGISTKPYIPSIHLFSFYKKMFGYKKGDFPISEKISDQNMALPIYIGLTKKDVAHIVYVFVRELQSLVKQKT